MREFLDRLWAPLEDAGRCEFVADFAKPYPSLTIATVMGAPLDDAPKLHEWSNLIQRQFDPHSLMHEREAIERAVRGVLRVGRGADRAPPRRPRRRSHLHADRGRRTRATGSTTRSA